MAVGFYVSSVDGRHTALMLGPFSKHEHALAWVDHAFKKADELDPRAWFRAWGTARVEMHTLPSGNMNRHFLGPSGWESNPEGY
jgi:hypothetical protein